MAPVKVAINGCGRIGRLAFRAAFDQADKFEFVHLNDLASAESTAYLLQFDSVHGTWAGHELSAEGGCVVVTTKDRVVKIPYSQAKSPAQEQQQQQQQHAESAAEVQRVQHSCSSSSSSGHAELPGELEYAGLGVQQPYLDKGVPKVVVSAPVKDPNPVLNVVMGCNHDLYKPEVDHIVTAASCTTNCLAPVVKVIHEKLGIAHGCITTIHNLTNTQAIVDAPNAKKATCAVPGDLHRTDGRGDEATPAVLSALMNLAPTSTGSATAIALIFPELKGKLNGLAVRVPLTNSSITDCVFEVKKATTAEEVNALLKEASETYLAGILGFETRPLVSVDYVNDSRSSIVDAACTQVIDGTMVKLYAWYDNEWGYSCRLVDLAAHVATSQ
ncbi:hypothetical protein COO60DRAFT_1703479 [Scenedesmus sp. NREL 46B-D3]|nr:hypothetical protein COO60DRAFT_1703479 [Scenedesmus sp. NREL 46B-D3]